MNAVKILWCFVLCGLIVAETANCQDSDSQLPDDGTPMRIFIFAGQSNMVGSDSHVKDIKNFPPFRGLEVPQEGALFSYCIGRENKTRSNGWTQLKPVNNIVGPELSFTREVLQYSNGRVGIIKCAAGGTHLGGDWNPERPQGFKMYPLALELVRDSLERLTAEGIQYKLEAFVWHQGENDMFNEDYKKNYGNNLSNYIARWRKDLNAPELPFFVGELCTKTIWGMDLRPRMYAISQGQKAVAASDDLVHYVPTSHIGVEIGNPVGLHYHYGTLGQLEQGVNYAHSYLSTLGALPQREKPDWTWPREGVEKMHLVVLAGHRNAEGERAFTQDLESGTPMAQALLKPQKATAFKFEIGGGYHKSGGWQALEPAGYYDTFGPELSMGRTLSTSGKGNFAIAKFTHSGSQLIDWTPEGSMAESRNLYSDFIEFIKTSVDEIKQAGFELEGVTIVYHVGENEMSMPPYRRKMADWLDSLIHQSRQDLAMPRLTWIVSQQQPTNEKSVNEIDVVKAIADLCKSDANIFHLRAFDLPPQKKRLVLDTAGIIRLGELMAERVLQVISSK